VFENRVPRRIFGPKRGEVTGGWRKLDNEELHNLYSSPIRLMKSRRMRWAGHVPRIWRKGMHIGYWWEIQKESEQEEDKDVGGWIILSRVLVTKTRVWIGNRFIG
jgi:hypothetical protein